MFNRRFSQLNMITSTTQLLRQKAASAMNNVLPKGDSSSKHDEQLQGNWSSLDNLWFDNSDVFSSDRDFGGDEMELESDLSGYEEDRESSDESTNFRSERYTNNGEVASKDHSSLPSTIDYYDKANKMEPMWEHQELIDQLRMELKSARISSLPTIVEEAESQTDELKQCKTSEGFRHEHHMQELQKVFNSYREKMRKFDILNYQTMYAIGFMQLQNRVESTTTGDSSGTKLKSLVSKSAWLSRQKREIDEPSKKLIDELRADMEMVYVGQMCLSWEFLNWQYQKALDLCNSDPYGTHQYHATSGEFCQFQKLLQRFIDDEPFQGRRAEHFVQSRCVLCNLLQVPAISFFPC